MKGLHKLVEREKKKKREKHTSNKSFFYKNTISTNVQPIKFPIGASRLTKSRLTRSQDVT